MTSLTRTAILSRKIIRYGIYGIIIFIVARAILLTGFKIFRNIFPKAPPPPTVAFGKLPALPFAENGLGAGLTYALETPDGGLPAFPEQMKVYYMPNKTADLFSLENTKEKVAALGFSAGEEELTPTLFLFRHEKVPATLEINIVSGVFSISYDLASDPTPLDSNPIAGELAATKIKSFLKSGNTMPEDLQEGPATFDFLKISQGAFVPAISLSEADVVRVNLFRKSYDEYPSLTPNPGRANVWFITGGNSQEGKQIIGGQFHYFPVDEETVSTYPIKPAIQAWEDLHNGKAYIVSLGSEDIKEIKVRRSYLAYYDAGVPTEFYQPVIVFEGDNNFVAYVPAVTSEYYSEE